MYELQRSIFQLELRVFAVLLLYSTRSARRAFDCRKAADPRARYVRLQPLQARPHGSIATTSQHCVCGTLAEREGACWGLRFMGCFKATGRQLRFLRGAKQDDKQANCGCQSGHWYPIEQKRG